MVCAHNGAVSGTCSICETFIGYYVTVMVDGTVYANYTVDKSYSVEKVFKEHPVNGVSAWNKLIAIYNITIDGQEAYRGTSIVQDSLIELTTIPQSFTISYYQYIITEEGKDNYYTYDSQEIYPPYSVSECLNYFSSYDSSIHDYTVNGKRADGTESVVSDLSIVIYDKAYGFGAIAPSVTIDGVTTRYAYDGPVHFDFFKKDVLGEDYEKYNWFIQSESIYADNEIITQSKAFTAERITYSSTALVITEEGTADHNFSGLLTRPTVANVLEMLEIDPSEYYVFYTENYTYDYLITFYELDAAYTSITVIKKSLLTKPFTVTYSYRESDTADLITETYHYNGEEMELQPVSLRNLLSQHGVYAYDAKVVVNGEAVCDVGVKQDFPIMWFYSDVEIVVTPLYRYYVYPDTNIEDINHEGYVYEQRITPLQLAKDIGLNTQDYVWSIDGMKLFSDMLNNVYPYDGTYKTAVFNLEQKKVKVHLEICDQQGYIQTSYEFEEPNDILFSKVINGYQFEDYDWKATRWDGGEYGGGYGDYEGTIDLSSGEYTFTIDKTIENAVTYYLVTGYSKEFPVIVNINAKAPFYDDAVSKDYTFKAPTPIFDIIKELRPNYTQYRWYAYSYYSGMEEIDVTTYVATEMVEIQAEYKDSWVYFNLNGQEIAHYFPEERILTLADLIAGFVNLSFDDYAVWKVNGEQVYNTDVTLYSGSSIIATNDYSVRVTFETYGMDSGFDIEDWSDENLIRTYTKDSEWTTPTLIQCNELMQFVGWGYFENKDEYILINSIEDLFALKQTAIYLRVVSKVTEEKLYGCYNDGGTIYAFTPQGLWVTYTWDSSATPFLVTEYEIRPHMDGVEINYYSGSAYLYPYSKISEVQYMVRQDDNSYHAESLDFVNNCLNDCYVLESITDIYGNAYKSLDELTAEPTFYFIQLRYQEPPMEMYS